MLLVERFPDFRADRRADAGQGGAVVALRTERLARGPPEQVVALGHRGQGQDGPLLAVLGQQIPRQVVDVPPRHDDDDRRAGFRPGGERREEPVDQAGAVDAAVRLLPVLDGVVDDQQVAADAADGALDPRGDHAPALGRVPPMRAAAVGAEAHPQAVVALELVSHHPPPAGGDARLVAAQDHPACRQAVEHPGRRPVADQFALAVARRAVDDDPPAARGDGVGDDLADPPQVRERTPRPAADVVGERVRRPPPRLAGDGRHRTARHVICRRHCRSIRGGVRPAAAPA